jgi:cytochrome c oxidase cbb3-type subunit I/II
VLLCIAYHKTVNIEASEEHLGMFSMAATENTPVETKSENTKTADSVAKYWLYSAMIWFPVFTTFGLIMAIKFFVPTFLVDSAFDTFGRIRPAHVNGLLFGFLSSGLVGAMYYVLPRLTNSPLYKPLIGKVSAVIWNGGVLAGVILILAGDTQAREYAEMPWIIDVAILAVLILIGVNVIGTLIKRKERKLYVSLWFFAGIVFWFPVVYFIGNVMWNPPSGALFGLTDSIFNWFYGHNVLGLWFTPFGLAFWYYFIPKLSKRALYSVSLSLISFFALAFFYTGVGGHHLLQSAIPEWLKTLAVSMSALMMFSVITFGANIGMTLRGAWHNIFSNVPLRFIVFGFINYIFVSVQGTFQAFRDMNIYLHYSQWPVMHAHYALYAAFGITVMGIMFWVVPRIAGKPLYNKQLMDTTWWATFLGFLMFMAGMMLAGLVQNAGWFTHMTIAQVLPTLQPYFILRAMGGGIVVVSAFLFAINISMTILSKRKIKAADLKILEVSN